MEMNTLLTVRLKSRGYGPCIGNDEKQLGRTSGYTLGVVHATAESIVKAREFEQHDQRLVASGVDEGLLEFDSYEDERQSRYGRPVLEMVREDGVDAYEALGDNGPRNAYLHAALYDTDVWTAARELDVTPDLVVETDDGLETIDTGWNSPDIISAAILVGDDDEYVECDLRDFEPDVDWVIENWRSVGGSRNFSRRYKEAEDADDQLEDYILDETDDAQPTIFNSVERSFTAHQIKGVEEAVVGDEEDRYVAKCGTTFPDTDDLLKLDVDTDTVDDKHQCGNCF